MSKFASQALVALVFLCASSVSLAAGPGTLTIDGVVGPGGVGSYPPDAAFSWIDHRYPDNSVSHIWELAAGTDGGILLGQGQPGKGELTEVRPMYNLNSWLYTVADGIKLNGDSSLDFSNLRMDWGGTILDLGTAPGFDPLVPLISDITQLSGNQNGYAIYSDNSYDLIYHSAGLCDGCILTVHFHGNALPVPEPQAFMLWCAGLGSIGARVLFRQRRRNASSGHHSFSMTMTRLALFLAGLLLFPLASSAAPAADTILLRTSCDNGSGGVLNNCFQDLTSLNQWVAGQVPSPANPLRIEIGPGTFQGTFECQGIGGISIEGSGITTTTISSDLSSLEPGILTSDCSGLNVAHLTVKGGYRAVHLGGSSVTNWTDVEVLGGARGVYSTYKCDPSITKHTWRNSRIEAIPRGMTVAYDARCGEHDIFGSELIANGSPAQYGANPNNIRAMRADQTSGKVTVRVTGSMLKSLLTMPNAGAVPMAAVTAGDGAEIYIAGSQIEVTSTESHDIRVLQANSGGIIQVYASTYKLATIAPATVTRISTNGGFVYAPYRWAAPPNPGLIPGYTSQPGADTRIITDGTSDGHPHDSVYDPGCPSGTSWFDQVDKVCR